MQHPFLGTNFVLIIYFPFGRRSCFFSQNRDQGFTRDPVLGAVTRDRYKLEESEPFQSVKSLQSQIPVNSESLPNTFPNCGCEDSYDHTGVPDVGTNQGKEERGGRFFRFEKDKRN